MPRTNLSRLKVSLTKHNAHKLAVLLKQYPADQVLNKLGEVQANESQSRKNLSVSAGGKLPGLWEKARALSDAAVDALVFLGIVFSHHALISAMMHASAQASFCGRIERDKQLGGKAYTNFARITDQLGYARTVTRAGFTYDLAQIFQIRGLGPLVAQLLELKLDAAGWDRKNSLLDEVRTLGLSKAFGLNATELSRWLLKDLSPESGDSQLLTKDQEFFESKDEGLAQNPFKFRSGHVERAVSILSRSASRKTKASQLHNDIQNRLYNHLCKNLGKNNVGTEVATGAGTSVDLVAREKGRLIFYEIKTASSVRSNIRQAIPQLLEYAFWPEAQRAAELVIVSHLQITKQAHQYLRLLRKKFNLPIEYRQFDMNSNKLV